MQYTEYFWYFTFVFLEIIYHLTLKTLKEHVYPGVGEKWQNRGKHRSNASTLYIREKPESRHKGPRVKSSLACQQRSYHWFSSSVRKTVPHGTSGADKGPLICRICGPAATDGCPAPRQTAARFWSHPSRLSMVRLQGPHGYASFSSSLPHLLALVPPFPLT